jgi:DNA primase
VLDAVDMVSLVSSRTELRRHGVNSYFGLCPFHDERTPSFHVSPDEKLYHCFGCQASGNAFTFVMETEGVDFSAALEMLAKRFGVQLQTEREDPQAAARRNRRERLYTLLERATAYYARYLWEARESASAREYLLGRGLSEHILREFRVGFSPSAWDRLLVASRGAGFSDDELVAAGLAQRSRSAPGRIYDRFRGRIMFPCADLRGRVVGFGARAMRANQPPKYLNTAEGELYHKREILYGVQVARAAAARAGEVILVEGYTDVLALHEAGLSNAVGIMGTSLTEEQVGALEKIAPVLVLCLDADTAGQEAMVRAASLVGARNLELRVVPLPAGRDPADLVGVEGAGALRDRVARAVPFVSFLIERILARSDAHTVEGRDQAVRKLRPLFASLPTGYMRDELGRRVSGALSLSSDQLGELMRRGESSPRSQPSETAADAKALARDLADPAVRGERAFLALCLALPSAGKQALEAIDLDEHITSARLRRAARHLSGRLDHPLGGLPPEDEELARTVADLVERAGRAGTVRAEHIEQQRLYLERARLERAIRRALAVSSVAGGGSQTRASGVGEVQRLAREGDVHGLVREDDVEPVAIEGDVEPVRAGDVQALAREKEAVRAAIQELDARLERPV